MSAPYIDVLIADATVIPQSERRHYSESVIYLPDSFFPTDAKRRIADVPTRRHAG